MKESWKDSVEICEKYGMELATFDSPKESQDLLEAYRHKSIKHSNVWVGYTDENHEGAFISSDDKLLHNKTCFHEGEPTNGEDGIAENCIEIFEYDGEHKYNDNQCSRKFHYMCQENKTISIVDELRSKSVALTIINENYKKTNAKLKKENEKCNQNPGDYRPTTASRQNIITSTPRPARTTTQKPSTKECSNEYEKINERSINKRSQNCNKHFKGKSEDIRARI